MIFWIALLFIINVYVWLQGLLLRHRTQSYPFQNVALLGNWTLGIMILFNGGYIPIQFRHGYVRGTKDRTCRTNNNYYIERLYYFIESQNNPS